MLNETEATGSTEERDIVESNVLEVTTVTDTVMESLVPEETAAYGTTMVTEVFESEITKAPIVASEEHPESVETIEEMKPVETTEIFETVVTKKTEAPETVEISEVTVSQDFKSELTVPVVDSETVVTEEVIETVTLHKDVSEEAPLKFTATIKPEFADLEANVLITTGKKHETNVVLDSSETPNQTEATGTTEERDIAESDIIETATVTDTAMESLVPEEMTAYGTTSVTEVFKSEITKAPTVVAEDDLKDEDVISETMEVTEIMKEVKPVETKDTFETVIIKKTLHRRRWKSQRQQLRKTSNQSSRFRLSNHRIRNRGEGGSCGNCHCA